MQIFTKMIWFIRNVNRFLSDNKNILNISSHIWIQKIKDKVYIVYFIVPPPPQPPPPPPQLIYFTEVYCFWIVYPFVTLFKIFQ